MGLIFFSTLQKLHLGTPRIDNLNLRPDYVNVLEIYGVTAKIYSILDG